LTRKETKFCCVGREQKHKGEKKKKKRRQNEDGGYVKQPGQTQDGLRMHCNRQVRVSNIMLDTKCLHLIIRK